MGQDKREETLDPDGGFHRGVWETQLEAPDNKGHKFKPNSYNYLEEWRSHTCFSLWCHDQVVCVSTSLPEIWPLSCFSNQWHVICYDQVYFTWSRLKPQKWRSLGCMKSVKERATGYQVTHFARAVQPYLQNLPFSCYKMTMNFTLSITPVQAWCAYRVCEWLAIDLVNPVLMRLVFPLGTAQIPTANTHPWVAHISAARN